MKTTILHALVGLLAATPVVLAQSAEWNPDSVRGLPGPPVAAASQVTPWDPDGAGPLPERLAVATNWEIWSLDPVTAAWEQVPAPSQGVRNLVARPNGTLYCVEQMPNGFDGVSFFNGTTWQFLDSGTNGVIKVLRVHSNGELLVGGRFTTIGGTPARNIAWRQGNQWVTFGQPVQPTPNSSYLSVASNGHVADITVDGAGDVAVSGRFMSVVTVNSSGFGTTTPALVAGFQNGQWNAFPGTPGILPPYMAVQPNGTLVGAFWIPNSGTQVARWQGQTVGWIPMGPVLNGGVSRLLVNSQGDLCVGGSFVNQAGAPDYIARWDGSNWLPLGTNPAVDGPIADLSRDPLTGDLVVVGDFGKAGDHRAENVATWNGSSWGLLGRGVNDTIRALAHTDAPGEFYLGGDFTWVSGGPAGHVARWTGSSAVPLGTGVDGPVHALLKMSNGDLIVGGDFATAGGAPAASIARWDGATWSALGSGTDGIVYALAQLPNGDVVAGGEFTTAGGMTALGLARWNGSTWSEFDASVDGVTRALLVTANGDLVVGGSYASIGTASNQRVARWDGSAWTPMGLWTGHWIASLAELPNGDLVAGGSSPSGVYYGGLWRWTGVSWTSFPWPSPYVQPRVEALTVMPDGDLIAAGYGGFGGGATNAARWNGTSFERLEVSPNDPLVNAYALLRTDDGRVVVAGDRSDIGRPLLAFYDSTAPASVAPRGTACASSGGANTLEANSQPWIGADFEVRGSGFPDQSLVALFTGFSPLQLPLNAVFGTSPAGCEGLVTPDLVQTLTPQAGSFTSSLQLPDNPALIGMAIYQQALALDFGTTSAGLEITSSQALDLTIGDF